jgi:hypothetical protein
MLSRWSSVSEYVLVDLWQSQPNYADVADVSDELHNLNLEKTRDILQPFADKLTYCRNYTSACATRFEDGHFDFVYLDARHDFKGVYEDLVSWWPKLRCGGIMAGHDYVTQADGPAQSSQDWTLNYDGSVDHTGAVVKGAVDLFAAEQGLQITVSYRERGWNTWAFRKPGCSAVERELLAQRERVRELQAERGQRQRAQAVVESALAQQAAVSAALEGRLAALEKGRL